MLKDLRLLAYDRDLSKDNKEYWERDDQLSEAIWERAKSFIDYYSLTASKDEKSFAYTVLYSFIGELLEEELKHD